MCISARVQRYRIFILDQFGRINSGHQLLCRSDAEAARLAREMAGNATAEVWRDNRLVTKPFPA
ncbi:hypothetical protein CHU93_13560 [Sandarakinorhabdus cyanobacteriorum]|uniref:Uncharacterized protein n=1 Tax=Sandarakinorhabdus cyanobacteriorum TaxID=1981098 RepID=A0A255YAM3_9SPHN|nr:hypothetical protein [Sandarakinorhabdus cyanobacteriorum]OYQ25744.1 hypothetical protein CHU93_13560 [Sandarakinorhabdus cyanobacteriorum]